MGTAGDGLAPRGPPENTGKGLLPSGRPEPQAQHVVSAYRLLAQGPEEKSGSLGAVGSDHVPSPEWGTKAPPPGGIHSSARSRARRDHLIPLAHCPSKKLRPERGGACLGHWASAWRSRAPVCSPGRAWEFFLCGSQGEHPGHRHPETAL